jgi:hypothetical protein
MLYKGGGAIEFYFLGGADAVGMKNRPGFTDTVKRKTKYVQRIKLKRPEVQL